VRAHLCAHLSDENDVVVVFIVVEGARMQGVHTPWRVVTVSGDGAGGLLGGFPCCWVSSSLPTPYSPSIPLLPLLTFHLSRPPPPVVPSCKVSGSHWAVAHGCAR
jgi:hypothetical protein